jgi:hypothetical protein
MTVVRRAVLVAAALCALVVLLSAAPSTAEAAPPWSDLSVSILDTYGLTQDALGQMSSGFPDGTWRPDNEVTRGQFVKLALGYFRIPVEYPSFVQPHFVDVSQASPYFGWAEAALGVGLISGYEVPSSTTKTVLGLYDPITREQAVLILARYLAKMDPEVYNYSTYADGRVDELLAPFLDQGQVSHRKELAMAVEVGILQGSVARLSPKAHLTRIQAAALIVRTQGLLPPPVEEPSIGNPHVLDWLFSDAYLRGITVGSMRLGRMAPWMPRTLVLTVRLEAEGDLTAYRETAESLVALAEQYKDEMKYERVRVVIAVPGGAWVYDHTFDEAPVAPAHLR